jgi:hypothetical protein
MANETDAKGAPATPSLLESVDPATLTKDTVPRVAHELGALKVDDAVSAMGLWWPSLSDSARAAFVQWRWDRKEALQRLRGCLLLAATIHHIDKDRAHALLNFTYAKEPKPAARARALREMWLSKRPKRATLALAEVDARSVPAPLATLLADDLFIALEEVPAKPENDRVRQIVVDWLVCLLPTLREGTRSAVEAKLNKLRSTLQGAPTVASVGSIAREPTVVKAMQVTASAAEGRAEPRKQAQLMSSGTAQATRLDVPAATGPAGQAHNTAQAPSTADALIADARHAASAAAALLGQAEAALAERSKSAEQSRREHAEERDRLTRLLAEAERDAAQTVSNLSDKLDRAHSAHDALRLEHESVEAKLASALSELEQVRTEAKCFRGELAKERELRLEAVAKERQETQRRMREQLSQALQPEFAKLSGGTDSDGGAPAFALKVLGTIRQRLKAQGIEV